MSVPNRFNHSVAEMFREFAELLQLQQGNPFRINAYVRAAATIDSLKRDLREILKEQGTEGLVELPTIGSGLAVAIEEIARTGTFSQLERFRGSLDPAQLFATIPGIGEKLSRRIHDELHVDTLEALELAAHDGRLESVAGVGKRRAAAIRMGIAGMKTGGGRAKAAAGEPQPLPAAAWPSVELLLDVDATYRAKARKNELPKIAPKRFNPEHRAWLPILHTQRDAWHFTALYSNTARAHELRRTDDWVVIYFYDDGHREGQFTVVTELQGDLRGKRVVRGREQECRRMRAADAGS